MRTFGFPEFLFILEAAQWTLALSRSPSSAVRSAASLIALARTSDSKTARALSTALHPGLPGHAAAAAAVPDLLRRAGAGPRHQPVDRRRRGADPQQRRLPRRDLARLHRGDPARPVGGGRGAGLHYVARMRDVVLPQAFKIAVPPTVGYMVQIIKGTSLAAIIGFTEVTRAGQIINNATFQPLHRLQHGGGDLLRPVLAAVAAGRAHGAPPGAARTRALSPRRCFTHRSIQPGDHRHDPIPQRRRAASSPPSAWPPPLTACARRSPRPRPWTTSRRRARSRSACWSTSRPTARPTRRTSPTATTPTSPGCWPRTGASRSIWCRSPARTAFRSC